MTNEQFAAQVRKLEDEARRSPRAYQLKVLVLAALGNAYIALVLVLVAALFFGLVAALVFAKGAFYLWKLVAVLGVFLWAVLKAVIVKIPEPGGLRIHPEQAPELFATIERLRRKLDAPPFHRVLITGDFNAGVVQVPRLGAFGWYQNDLLIGLPLMKALTPQQFEAVLAHEFGHLAKGHGALSNWVYRQRQRWSRLMAVLEANESQGRALFKPFLKLFAPYFNAYSFPLARANEYEADAAAVRLTSPAAAAAALTGVGVLGSYFEERYWPRVYERATDEPKPPAAPFSSIDGGLAADLDESSRKRWLERAMAAETSLADTHPSLRDRLAAIGAPPQLSPPAPGEAADALLGPSRQGIAETFDRDWTSGIASAWGERHAEMQKAKAQLEVLNRKFESGEPLTLQEAFDRAMYTESPGRNPDGALAQLRALQEQAPEEPVVCFKLGERLLARDESVGQPLIEHAMKLDEESVLLGCQLLRDFHWRNGRKAEAEAWQGRLVEWTETLEASGKERKNVAAADDFEPHGLPAEIVERLRAQLGSIEGLVRAYLVRKRVKHFPHRPLYVLGFGVTRRFRFHRVKRADAVLSRIQGGVDFPGEALIINVEGENRKFERKFRRVTGARIL